MAPGSQNLLHTSRRNKVLDVVFQQPAPWGNFYQSKVCKSHKLPAVQFYYTLLYENGRWYLASGFHLVAWF